MGHNTFGHEFSVTTFGESHGKAIGVVIDGLESGLSIDMGKVQEMMDRRRPGGNAFGTKRNETDEVQLLSGVFEGKSTGTPLAMLIWNNDQRSGDYAEMADLYRPGHADYTYQKKWGIRDYRGGGRSSGRETASRVMAGAVALQALEKRGVKIVAGTVQVGTVTAVKRDWQEAGNNPFSCPDAVAAEKMAALTKEASSRLDSVGGVIECKVTGLPCGLGEPVFDKIDAEIGKALLSIGAVKGVEFGDGFLSALHHGSGNNDQMEGGAFLSNHAGGMLGGITNGDELVVRAAFKPTPSIAQEQKTMDKDGKDRVIAIKGRHDPCVCPRAVVVVISMVAMTLLDAYYEQFGRNIV